MKLTAERARLDSLLSKARAMALSDGRPALVSFTEAGSFIDPFAALESLSRASASDPKVAAILREGRVYWNRSSDGFAFAGVGAAFTIAPKGSKRFAEADEAWSDLLRRAVIESSIDPAVEPHPRPGPIAAGGFAFESESPDTTEWRSFAAANLIVPRLLVTSAEGTSWVTLSAVVSADDDIESIAEEWIHLLSSAQGSAAAAESVAAGGSGVIESDRMPAERWSALVAEAVREIHRGRIDKVVLARAVQLSAGRDIDALAILRHLIASHSDAFVFAYWRGSTVFLGATPERLVRLEGRLVEASSLAGTAKRDGDPRIDRTIASDLLASTKDRFEHSLVRYAIVAALDAVCEDVVAPESPSLLTLPHVHHLHTEIRGLLRPGHSILDLVERLHPTPAVGGSPRHASLEFIREKENLDRGWYAGPIGWVGQNGGEFAVALRSALISGSRATLFAGCGIVADSDPDLELAESRLKLQPMQAAIAAALGTTGELPRKEDSSLAART
jgi:isochorismate synthase